MIRHVWSILCSKASIDRQSNNVSLFEIIEGVQFTTFLDVKYPANVPFEGAFVTLWSRVEPSSAIKARARVRFLDPRGDSLLENIIDVNLETHGRQRTIMQFQGLRITGPGSYEWEVSSQIVGATDWKIETKVPMDIQIVLSAKPAAIQ